MKKYLKYVVPFFFVAPSLGAGDEDMPMTQYETAPSSPTDAAGAMPGERSTSPSPYAAVSPRENTFPPPPEAMGNAPVPPSYPVPTSDAHRQETMAKKYIEILAHHEAILEKAGQDIADRKEELGILRAHLAKENAPSNQNTEAKAELSREVIPPQPAELPTVSSKAFQNERPPSQIAPNNMPNPNLINPSTYTTVDEHGEILEHEPAKTEPMENFQKAEHKKIKEIRSDVVTDNLEKSIAMEENPSMYVVP